MRALVGLVLAGAIVWTVALQVPTEDARPLKRGGGDAEPVMITQAEWARVQASLKRVDAQAQALDQTKQELARVQARVERLEVRDGGVAFAPKHLGVPDKPMRMAWADGLLVKSHGARPTKGKLARHVAGFDATVVAFWATWCKPCTTPEELERLKALRGLVRAEGGELVSVAVDSVAKVQGDRRARGWLYPLWQLDDGHMEMLPRAFIQASGLGLPLFAVVSPSGTIRYTRNGPLDDAVIDELVTAVRRSRGR